MQNFTFSSSYSSNHFQIIAVCPLPFQSTVLSSLPAFSSLRSIKSVWTIFLSQLLLSCVLDVRLLCSRYGTLPGSSFPSHYPFLFCSKFILKFIAWALKKKTLRLDCVCCLLCCPCNFGYLIVKISLSSFSISLFIVIAIIGFALLI